MQGTCDEKLLTMLGKSKSRQHFALMGRALAWYGDETGYEAVGTAFSIQSVTAFSIQSVTEVI